MSKWRLIKNSVRFAFRAKRRWITFVVIFALLSAFTTLFINIFNSYGTELLLYHKGFYIKANDYGTVTLSQGEALSQEILKLPQVESVHIFKYFDLGSYIRVFSIDVASRWLFKEAKPSFLLHGQYLTGRGQALISKNNTFLGDSGLSSINISITIKLANILTFDNSTSTFRLSVVGELGDKIVASHKLKLFVTEDDFTQLHDFVNVSTPIYCYSMAVLVNGPLYNPFDNSIYNNKMALDDPDEPLSQLVKNPTYGLWGDPDPGNPAAAKKDRASRFLYFIVGIAGGIVLTILYNFLIVWFRKREIAILRALGYENGEIRINMLGESFTISFIGYIVGIASIIIYYAANGMTFSNQLLSIWAILASFGIVVLITIPGLLLSSFSFVRVSPIILFRGR